MGVSQAKSEGKFAKKMTKNQVRCLVEFSVLSSVFKFTDRNYSYVKMCDLGTVTMLFQNSLLLPKLNWVKFTLTFLCILIYYYLGILIDKLDD